MLATALARPDRPGGRACRGLARNNPPLGTSYLTTAALFSTRSRVDDEPTSDELLGRELGEGDFTPDAAPGTQQGEVRARSYWEQVWRRFKRDRVAIASVVFLVLLILVVYPGAWIAERLLGHGPNQIFPDALDDGLLPVGPMSTVTNFETGDKQLLILGADGTLGRDEFLRLLYGGRVSLQVALISTFFVMTIGVTLGAVAGYYRGWVDTIVAR